MTPEAILADTIFRYIDAVNTADVDAFGQVFMADGLWHCPGLFRCEGREEIHTMIEAAMGRYDWLFQVSYNSAVVSATSSEIRGRTYVSEYGANAGGGHFMLAVYDDRCMPDGDIWRFAERRCSLLYRGTSALTAPAIAYPAPRGWSGGV
jgi:hypothetical protein